MPVRFPNLDTDVQSPWALPRLPPRLNQYPGVTKPSKRVPFSWDLAFAGVCDGTFYSYPKSYMDCRCVLNRVPWVEKLPTGCEHYVRVPYEGLILGCKRLLFVGAYPTSIMPPLYCDPQDIWVNPARDESKPLHETDPRFENAFQRSWETGLIIPQFTRSEEHTSELQSL